jgi:hypothetical protein
MFTAFNGFNSNSNPVRKLLIKHFVLLYCFSNRVLGSVRLIVDNCLNPKQDNSHFEKFFSNQNWICYSVN